MAERTQTFHPPPDQGATEEAKISTQWPASFGTPVYSARVGDVVQAGGMYHLDVELGGGGFGSVFLATVLKAPEGLTDQKVALKFFRPLAGRRARELAAREFSSLRRIRSPRIPAVYDGNLDVSNPFFVMKYYPDGGLFGDSEREERLDESTTLRVLHDVTEALVAAHSGSLLHLDIKPQNILIDLNGGYALADFGITQSVRAGIGGGATIGLGTRGYRAPELVRCDRFASMARDPFRELDVRTDLWALGATTWALQAGVNLSKWASEAAPDGEFCPLPPLTEHCPMASRQIERLIAPLLASDPADRPGSAAEFLEEVRAVRDGRSAPSVLFGPESPRRLATSDSAELLDSLFDPLWRSLLDQFGNRLRVLRFEAGEMLCEEGTSVHLTFVLLRGQVDISIRGRSVEVEEFEGAFLGEIATLTGKARSATVTALTETYVAVFNAAELEQFLAHQPAVCLRLLKLMARRHLDDREL